MCLSLWSFRYFFTLNEAEQMSHLKGRSLECIVLCSFKRVLVLNFAEHTSHEKRRTSYSFRPFLSIFNLKTRLLFFLSGFSIEWFPLSVTCFSLINSSLSLIGFMSISAIVGFCFTTLDSSFLLCVATTYCF